MEDPGQWSVCCVHVHVNLCFDPVVSGDQTSKPASHSMSRMCEDYCTMVRSTGGLSAGGAARRLSVHFGVCWLARCDVDPTPDREAAQSAGNTGGHIRNRPRCPRSDTVSSCKSGGVMSLSHTVCLERITMSMCGVRSDVASAGAVTQRRGYNTVVDAAHCGLRGIQ